MNKTEPIFVRNNSVCLKICVRLTKHRICVRLTENRPLDYAEIKKTKEVNKNIIKNIRHKEFVVVLLVKNKVNYIELELMVFAKFLCLLLMI